MMEYKKLNLTDDQTLNAEHLAHMEEGIEAAMEAAEKGSGVQINDAVVDIDTTWSGRNIVDRLCPAFSESGAVATCQPVAGYPLEVVSHIQPVQAGSGDPSPENVRPITGHTAVKLWRGGLNLWDEQWEKGGISTLTAQQGTTRYGKVDNSATAVENSIRSKNFIPVKANVGLRVYSPQMVKAVYYDMNKQGVTASYPSAGSTLTPEQDGYIKFVIGGTVGSSPAVTEYGNNICISIDNGNPAVYEPYRGNAFTMDLGQTVYGGSLNWQTGVLTINRGMVEMDGSTDENWRFLSSHSDGPGFFYRYLDNVAKDNLICDRLRTNTAGVWYGSDNAIYAWTGELRMFVKDIELSVEAFRAWLSENPLHICYKLENPITVQLTAQEILALSGTNNLYSSTGDTAVTGRADPAAVMEKLTNAILALGGNI